MAEDQSQQGSDPGYVVMTPEDVIALSRKAADEAVNRYKSQADNGDGDNLIGLDGKFVKQLQNTVGVFNALKDFSSSPLQKVVEEKVGQFAAGMVENAFSGPRSPEKKNLIETILNSQFAYGLGASLGNKSPELIEAMSRNLGREQTQHIIDNVITKGTQGSGQGQSQPGGGQGSQQDNVELLLSLDANNPEHIAAYSESQGGLPPDVARKMLMIHQDAIIKRFGDQGANVQKAGSGQRSQSPPTSGKSQSRMKTVEEVHKDTPEDPMQYANYDEFPSEDVVQKADTTRPDTREQSTGINSNGEMLDVMKKFSNDIGQAMSAMIEEISTLKGTVTQLRGEIDTIRSDRPMPLETQDPIVRQPPEVSPVVQSHITPPMSVRTRGEHAPPTVSPPVIQSPATQPPVVQHIPSQPDVVSYQPRVDRTARRYEDTGFGKQENMLVEQDIYTEPMEQETVLEPMEHETVAELVSQEPEKSLEEMMNIREHHMTADDIVDIKPKKVAQSSVSLGQPIDTGPDIKWTDEDLTRDLKKEKKAKELNQSTPKPKDITEELTKVAEENKIASNVKKVQKAEDIAELKDVVNIEEKRPIVPIKRSDIRKKIKPLIKKIENDAT